MRVGVYVDGYNLYYGGRSLCGRGTAGWRWLDIRALAHTLITERRDWTGASIHRVVYCTARVDSVENPTGHADQDVYLKALRMSGCVDHIEYGHYVSRVKSLPLAIRQPNGRPRLVAPSWPVMVQDDTGAPVKDAKFMVSVAAREEKGSDVNLAAHLLLDVLRQVVDAALVLSNDSDLRLPLEEARNLVPVGLINPSPNQTAGALRGTPSAGAGRHFWRSLRGKDLLVHQLHDPVGNYRKPHGW